MSNPLLIFPSLSRPPWQPSQQQQQHQPTHPPPPMLQRCAGGGGRDHQHHLQLNTFPNQPTHRPLLLLAGAGCLQLGTGGDSTSCNFGSSRAMAAAAV
ncbi:hypothetical protein PTSG_06992 [Salpingoeca rosetta]|uniref:Uncharacterized protein n=1 Tax=Salpingoeca rosetta (strain ATCC 50818 / BSB-021) TaxID=946362 RepID=F2UFE3_SALR5|nr:uncharacterized protein PTSG_06992 [Salpingoeca rosetta]EGD75343.1 hypothetical protein PTSG_06992 [Salpingoeca rosetta]|eukprot:XP_004992396.1 hypothetical protein PTSG_06992 [Salpingoeca rosetta]